MTYFAVRRTSGGVPAHYDYFGAAAGPAGKGYYDGRRLLVSSANGDRASNW